MRRLLDTHPNAVLPIKAALAAVIAWLAVRPVGGFIGDYQYYAPLGAVVTVSPVLVRSARSGLRAVLAIVTGGLLAIGAHALPLPQLLAIALVVAAGVACSSWRRLGSMGSWVPFVALFALILHGHHPWHYVAAYVLLAGVGALIGLLVGLLLPQVPTGPATRAEQRLSDEVAHALEVLANAISSSKMSGQNREGELLTSLGDKSHELRDAVRRLGAARRANWRAGATAAPAERIAYRARSLQRLADSVVDVLEVADGTALTRPSGEAAGSERLPPQLESALVDALCRAAESLREWSRGAASAWSAQDLDELIRLREALMRQSVQLGGEPRLALVGVAAGLQRIADGRRQEPATK